MTSILEQRILYDYDFLAQGCPPESYDPIYKQDDTPGTYWTNYIIALFGLVIAFRIWWIIPKQTKENVTENASERSPGKSLESSYDENSLELQGPTKKHSNDLTHNGDATKFTRNSQASSYARISYFALTASGYAIAGLGHQLRDSTENRFYFIFFSFLLVCSGLVSLQSDLAQGRLILQLLAGLLGAATLGLTHFVHPGVLVLYNILALIFVSIIYMRKGQIKSWLFGAGSLSIVLGLVELLALNSVCGDDGYEHCFEDCPLPNPESFNHNAIFHISVIIGLTLQGWQSIAFVGNPAEQEAKETPSAADKTATKDREQMNDAV